MLKKKYADLNDSDNQTELSMLDQEDDKVSTIRSSSDFNPGFAEQRKTVFLVLFVALFLGLLILTIYYGVKSNENDSGSSKKSNKDPKNLIIFIGDGMGMTQNRALQIYLNISETQIDKHFVGRYTTRSTGAVVTDSANGAHVFASGQITMNGYIGLDKYGNPTATILDAAKQKGMGTGVVATARITHATPSSFYAHSLTRNWENLIGYQMGRKNMNETMLDIAWGGGLRHFIPQSQSGSRRKDDWDFTSAYQQLGWKSLVYNRTEMNALTEKDLPSAGLFASSHIPYYIDRIHSDDPSMDIPGLMDLANQSLRLLSSKYKKEGWVLVVESGRVDHCCHDNDVACLINEMVEVEDTLEYLMQYAENDEKTLVVVLADHETGGFAMGRSMSAQPDSLVSYTEGLFPRDHDITGYYASFDYNYLIPAQNMDDIAYTFIYDWYPDALRTVKHSLSYIVNGLLGSARETGEKVTLSQLITSIESNLGIETTAQEQLFLNHTLYRDPLFGYVNVSNLYIVYWSPLMVHSLTMLMNARSNTGWTTHGHSGADVAISAYGPSSDLFRGHFTNDKVGRMLSELISVNELQSSATDDLRQQFLDGHIAICDATDRWPFYGWEHNVSYPQGNLLAPGYCVTDWV